MVSLLLAQTIAFAIGFLAVSLCWPTEHRSKIHLLIKLCLAAGVGHGITSALFFGWLLVYGQADRKYIISELVVVALLGGAHLVQRSGSKNLPNNSETTTLHPRLKYEWVIASAFWIGFASMLIIGVLAILREPYGNGWDAWAIYGVRARALILGGADWKDGFSALISWSHPDYPLLQSASAARIWVYCGREVVAGQAIVTMILSIATVGLVASTVTALRSRSQGYLSGLVVMALGTFLAYLGSAYADVPVMFFCTATFALFALHYESRIKSFRYMILAGLALGLAAWTKNEGLLLLVALLVAHLTVSLQQKRIKVYLRELLFLLYGLTPVLLIILYFKKGLAPPNDFVGAMGTETGVSKLLDPQRYVFIIRSVVREIFLHQGYGVGLAYVLPIYFACVGGTLKHKLTLMLWTIAMCVVAAGIFFVYLTTPYELGYQIKFSLDRLLLQQWPAFIFVYFLAALTPEESLNARS